jgi:hypothetical protein
VVGWACPFPAQAAWTRPQPRDERSAVARSNGAGLWQGRGRRRAPLGVGPPNHRAERACSGVPRSVNLSCVAPLMTTNWPSHGDHDNAMSGRGVASVRCGED